MAPTIPPTPHPHEGAPETTPGEAAFLDALTGPAPTPTRTPLIPAGMLEPTGAEVAQAHRRLAPYRTDPAMRGVYVATFLESVLGHCARNLSAGDAEGAATDIREMTALARAAREQVAR